MSRVSADRSKCWPRDRKRPPADCRETDSIVLLALSPCVLVQKYLHVAGLDLGLGLEDVASALALASTFWPRFIHPRYFTRSDVEDRSRRLEVMSATRVKHDCK